MRDIAARLTANRDVTVALFELRLEAARRPEVAKSLGEWMRAGFRGDVAFNTAAGLPRGEREVALFHYAIDGLLLDRLTVSIVSEQSTDDVVEELVAALLGRADSPGGLRNS